MKTCPICREMFLPLKKTSVVCSVSCRNLYNARVSAAKRGDALRDRGECKSYRKLNGNHEHRLVALPDGSHGLDLVVHHKNKNKRDNTPENLEVMTRAEHGALHSRRQYHCIVPTCAGAHLARGLCRFHHNRWKRGIPTIDGETLFWIALQSTKKNGKICLPN